MRIVHLHEQDYSLVWEKQIAVIKEDVDISEIFISHLNHYFANTNEQLKSHIEILKASSEKVKHLIEVISKDEKILRKYVGLIYRLSKKSGRVQQG